MIINSDSTLESILNDTALKVVLLEEYINYTLPINRCQDNLHSKELYMDWINFGYVVVTEELWGGQKYGCLSCGKAYIIPPRTQSVYIKCSCGETLIINNTFAADAYTFFEEKTTFNDNTLETLRKRIVDQCAQVV